MLISSKKSTSLTTDLQSVSKNKLLYQFFFSFLASFIGFLFPVLLKFEPKFLDM